MGWSETTAIYYKHGKIDRKAECDALFNDDRFTVLKSAMVGSTYYAAVQQNNTGSVFAAVVLTSTNGRNYFNFAFKDMDETCGPHECKCPATILDLLTDTNSDYANDWRERCRAYHASKKDKPSLGELKPGSIIEFTANGVTYTATKVWGCAHIRRENGVSKVVKLDTRWRLDGHPYTRASSRCINSWGYKVLHSASKAEAQASRDLRVSEALHTYA